MNCKRSWRKCLRDATLARQLQVQAWVQVSRKQDLKIQKYKPQSQRPKYVIPGRRHVRRISRRNVCHTGAYTWPVHGLHILKHSSSGHTHAPPTNALHTCSTAARIGESILLSVARWPLYASIPLVSSVLSADVAFASLSSSSSSHAFTRAHHHHPFVIYNHQVHPHPIIIASYLMGAGVASASPRLSTLRI